MPAGWCAGGRVEGRPPVFCSACVCVCASHLYAAAATTTTMAASVGVHEPVSMGAYCPGVRIIIHA